MSYFKQDFVGAVGGYTHVSEIEKEYYVALKRLSEVFIDQKTISSQLL